MRYYLISLRIDNYKQLASSNYSVVGLPEYSRMVEKIQPGDKIVLYVGKPTTGIPGIIEATSSMFVDHSLLWDDFFPKRIHAKPYIMLPEGTSVSMREVKNGLSFIRPELKKFGVYFMQGIRELSCADYTYLYEKVVACQNEI